MEKEDLDDIQNKVKDILRAERDLYKHVKEQIVDIGHDLKDVCMSLDKLSCEKDSETDNSKEKNDGIAFKIDNQRLFEALVNELEDIGVEIKDNVDDSYVDVGYNYFGVSVFDDNGKDTFACLSRKESFCKSKNLKILEFPEDWDKIIWYYEQQVAKRLQQLLTNESYEGLIEEGVKNSE